MRKLALVLAVALASGRASALGLGEIELRSALNEPFNAEIRLIVDQPTELDGAVVRLASQESFQQAGIERPAALNDLAFNVVRRADGRAVIEVTSSQPVREPYLDFIVQVHWPAGRLLREYTVLLDPPVFSGDKLAPVTAPVLVPVAPASKPQAAVQTPAHSPAAQSNPQTAAPARPVRSAPTPAPAAKDPAPAATRATPGTYGPTQRSDTAWAIAAQVRPDDVSIHQAMLALLAANPEAFYQGNINNLMAGYVLRVPGRELMTALSAQEAEREAARQYQQWKRASNGVPMTSEPSSGTQSAESSTAPAAMPGDQSPRLKLVAPSQAGTSAPGTAGQAVEQIRGDLAIALESADAARRENEELRARLSALEGQINSMQRLMTLKDETLGDLQQRLGEEVNIPQVPPAEQAPATESASAEPATPPPAVAPQPAASQETEAEPVFDLFNNPSLMAAGGGAALLLLVLAWLVARRRRAAADEDEGDIMIEPRQEPVVNQTALAEAAAPETQTMDEMARADADEPDSGQMAEVAEEVAKGAAGGVQETAEDLDVLHTAEGDIDPIVEADVYLAYRRYQQAEALIQGALTKNPHRHELKGKLLEIYYASRNTEAFQSLAETLYDELGQNSDDPLWHRVLPMGAELLPDHPLFRDSAATPQVAAGTASTAAAGSALFADEAVGDEGGESMQAGQGGDDLFGGEQSLDLDLDAAAATHESGEPAEEKFDLDLDLGGDGLSDSIAEDAAPSDESLDAALELPNTGAQNKAKAKQKTAAAEDDLLSEATGSNGKDESWDVDPAMSDFGSMDFNLDDSDFLAGTDVVGTKLDLARAYIDMGDQESARDILNEVLEEGNDQQKQEAQSLSQQLA